MYHDLDLIKIVPDVIYVLCLFCLCCCIMNMSASFILHGQTRKLMLLKHVRYLKQIVKI